MCLKPGRGPLEQNVGIRKPRGWDQKGKDTKTSKKVAGLETRSTSLAQRKGGPCSGLSRFLYPSCFVWETHPGPKHEPTSPSPTLTC